MSHVHAFSCIRTFMFLPFDIKTAWYFSDCLSFSLSPSPSYVSCIMTPKRKSTPSQNPLRSRASSSSYPSYPTPSHVQFHDEVAKSNFLEYFSRRGIHLERQVILLDFFDTDLPTIIHSEGWESLCGIPVMCHSLIVHEFYSNMHGLDYFIPSLSLVFRVYVW